MERVATAALVLLLSVLSAGAQTDPAGPCSFTATSGPISWNAALACLQALPFDPIRAKTTISAVSQIMQMYAFKDVVHNSPQISGLVHVQVDLQSEFQRVLQTQYTNDYQFQEAIAGIYRRLKDPHTLYIKPTCYRFAVVQPFNLTSILPYGRQAIQISDVQSYAAKAWPSQISQLQAAIGHQLLFIDGVDPVAAVTKAALSNGFMSKDIGSLFNYELQKNHFQRRFLVIDDFPTNPSVTYSFFDNNGNIQNLTVPWMAVPTAPVDASCFQNAMDEPAGGSVPSKPSSAPPVLRILKEDEETLFRLTTPPPQPEAKREAADHSFKAMHQRMVEKRQITPGGLITLASTADVQAYVLSNDTLILKINTYEPDDNTVFLNIVWNTIALGKTFNVPNMILDVSGNGGGDICLGYQVITGLMEEQNPYGKYDIIHNPLMNTLAETLAQPQNNGMPFSPGFWVNPATQQVFSNISWYEPGPSYTRGGPYTSDYTGYIHLACDAVQAPIRYLFQKLLLFSDGLCGSTCAVTSSHLAEADHVHSVVYGGISGRQQQYFSFPGGQVSQLGFIRNLATQIGVDQSLIPPNVPAGGVASFTLQEIYPWHGPETNTPLEFVYRPSTFRYLSWDVSNLADTYNNVRAQFLVQDRK